MKWIYLLLFLSSVLYGTEGYEPRVREQTDKHKMPPHTEFEGKVPPGGFEATQRPSFLFDPRRGYEPAERGAKSFQEGRSRESLAQPPYSENPRAHRYHPHLSPHPFHESQVDYNIHPRQQPLWRPRKWFPTQGQFNISTPAPNPYGRSGRWVTGPPVTDRHLYLRITHMLKGYNIGVVVNTGGNVTLTGAVNSVEERQNIENMIHAMNGVRNVDNQLTIANEKAMPRYQSKFYRKDEFIHRKVRPYRKTKYPYIDRDVRPSPHYKETLRGNDNDFLND